MFGSGDFLDKSPSWFLKILKLLSFLNNIWTFDHADYQEQNTNFLDKWFFTLEYLRI